MRILEEIRVIILECLFGMHFRIGLGDWRYTRMFVFGLVLVFEYIVISLFRRVHILFWLSFYTVLRRYKSRAKKINMKDSRSGEDPIRL
jgi:hypothetical protein